MRVELMMALCVCMAGCKQARGAAKQDPAPPASASAAAAAMPAPAAPQASCSPACASVERCDAGKCVPGCPPDQIYVPATGPDGFPMGHGPRGAFDQKHTVILTKPFCMDQTEVTVAAYRKCMDAGKCTMPQLHDVNSNFRPEYHRDNQPLNMVNWKQATAYCTSLGRALPTEAEWEWAAGHGDGRKWPWGNTPDPTCENHYADFTPGGAPKSDPAGDVGCYGGGSSPVKSFPLGVSKWPAGEIYELAGNVWEWVDDCYLRYPSGSVTDPDPKNNAALGGECYVHSLRGGGWNRSKTALHPYFRGGSKWTYRVGGLGFRCVTQAS